MTNNFTLINSNVKSLSFFKKVFDRLLRLSEEDKTEQDVISISSWSRHVCPCWRQKCKKFLLNKTKTV